MWVSLWCTAKDSLVGEVGLLMLAKIHFTSFDCVLFFKIVTVKILTFLAEGKFLFRDLILIEKIVVTNKVLFVQVLLLLERVSHRCGRVYIP